MYRSVILARAGPGCLASGWKRRRYAMRHEIYQVNLVSNKMSLSRSRKLRTP